MSNKYEKGAYIANGSFAECYLGRRREDGKEVCLKYLRSAHLAQERKQGRNCIKVFDNDERVHRTLNHENVVTFLESYDDHEEPGIRVIVMEYCSEGNLKSYICNKYPLNLEQLITPLSDIAAGMNYIHQSGCMHRDLKPDNILVSRRFDGKVTFKIADFGLAKQVDLEDPGRTICGNQTCYTAPEILAYIIKDANGNAYAQDPRNLIYGAEVDLWGVGAIFHFCITKMAPFHGSKGSLMDLMKNQYDNMVAQLKKKMASLGYSHAASGLLCHLITSLMNMEPIERLNMDSVCDVISVLSKEPEYILDKASGELVEVYLYPKGDRVYPSRYRTMENLLAEAYSLYGYETLLNYYRARDNSKKYLQLLKDSSSFVEYQTFPKHKPLFHSSLTEPIDIVSRKSFPIQYFAEYVEVLSPDQAGIVLKLKEALKLFGDLPKVCNNTYAELKLLNEQIISSAVNWSANLNRCTEKKKREFEALQGTISNPTLIQTINALFEKLYAVSEEQATIIRQRRDDTLERSKLLDEQGNLEKYYAELGERLKILESASLQREEQVAAIERAIHFHSKTKAHFIEYYTSHFQVLQCLNKVLNRLNELETQSKNDYTALRNSIVKLQQTAASTASTSATVATAAAAAAAACHPLTGRMESSVLGEQDVVQRINDSSNNNDYNSLSYNNSCNGNSSNINCNLVTDNIQTHPQYVYLMESNNELTAHLKASDDKLSLCTDENVALRQGIANLQTQFASQKLELELLRAQLSSDKSKEDDDSESTGSSNSNNNKTNDKRNNREKDMDIFAELQAKQDEIDHLKKENKDLSNKIFAGPNSLTVQNKTQQQTIFSLEQKVMDLHNQLAQSKLCKAEEYEKLKNEMEAFQMASSQSLAESEEKQKTIVAQLEKELVLKTEYTQRLNDKYVKLRKSMEENALAWARSDSSAKRMTHRWVDCHNALAEIKRLVVPGWTRCCKEWNEIMTNPDCKELDAKEIVRKVKQMLKETKMKK